MDPNAALKEIREILGKRDQREGVDWGCEPADRLADLIEGLDSWISRGGFLPKDWESKERKALKK